MNGKDQYPNFLIVGAGKSGTTSLDQYISSHPQIFMSKRKDPGFFASEPYELTDEMFPESVQYYKRFITNEAEYLDLFSGAALDQLTGETTTMYLYSDKSPTRIKSVIPEVKLIAVLRQPAERLYSRYLHLAREALLPTQHFEDLFDQSTKWWIRPDLIPEGYYYKHLVRFYDHFPTENILVVLYDDLKASKESVFHSLFTFLGVDPSYIPETGIHYNQSGMIKNKLINSLIGYNNPAIRAIRKISPSIWSTLKGNKKLLKTLNTMRSKNLYRPELSIELKKKITEEIYIRDIKKLEKLIERDLSGWYKF